MTSPCFIMNINRIIGQNGSDNVDAKPPVSKEKIMSYEEKSVGSTNFYKCEACPYMALAEDDIKFHLFTVHPDLAIKNGLADNIQIPCPGCTSVFDTEETLRTHLRNHHKMGIKDVKKMVKSLVQIALKNAKLKKEVSVIETPATLASQEIEVKMPQLIEIVPDIAHSNNEGHLPKGVAFISVDELNKMSTPNFEKVDPKDVIQEASINIVYTNDVSTQYVNVSNANAANSPCNIMQVSSVPPDLISSIHPHISSTTESNLSSPQKDSELSHKSPQKAETNAKKSYTLSYNETNLKGINHEEKGTLCSFGSCHMRLKDPNNLSYHRKCHLNDKLQCQECLKKYNTVEALHTHLWNIHSIDLELPTCEICGHKTFKRYRLLNIHMKCHGGYKGYSCSICSKTFKNANQLSKHRLIHKRDMNSERCPICDKEFTNDRSLRTHIAAVHEKLKPFKCCHCDYTAARKEELKLHLRSHTGEKPYACDECSYCSADHNAMRRHKKKHSKEGVYKCKFCPYSAIQSTVFATHMISKHPNVNSSDVHCCPYCPYKSVSKEKYLTHLTTHRDEKGIKLLMELNKSKSNIPSWTIPSESTEKPTDDPTIVIEQSKESSLKTVNSIPIEVFDCDSLPETMPQEYSKSYCTASGNDTQTPDFSNQVNIVTDLSKDDNNSDCLISESSNDTMIERHQYTTQIPLQMSYDTAPTNLHFLNTAAVSLEQNLLQNTSVNSLSSSHSPISNSMGNNIMSNFPIRLPHTPLSPMSVRNSITLKPVNQISLPMTKVIGPIITPMQILPIPLSHSPVNVSNELEGVPRKKPKISVKSNLVLKGPDQVNMFHSQQKMAFKRLEDNERFGLGGTVTFNNLTQFMQLQPEPVPSESPNNIMPYPRENMLEDVATTPVDNEMNDDPQIFSFSQQMNVNSMTILPPPQKIQTNDPSYIKFETTIKQNTQSPSLERMCSANLLNNPAIAREYKASPPLEDIHKNMNIIKNEVKSDTFYNLALNNTTPNPPIIDQYLIDNIIPEQYPSLIDLSTVVLPEASQQNDVDVIEIDDNSDDNKLLPRFDMNFSLESLYLMHNDFHFLENDVTSEGSVNEMSRIIAEVPIINHKDGPDVVTIDANNDCSNLIQGKKDPMMNMPMRQPTNKINVKNIELMKN